MADKRTQWVEAEQRLRAYLVRATPHPEAIRPMDPHAVDVSLVLDHLSHALYLNARMAGRVTPGSEEPR